MQVSSLKGQNVATLRCDMKKIGIGFTAQNVMNDVNIIFKVERW